MKVFISWSGDESRQIAEALRDWLATLSESVEPYMSARDNEAGVRWNSVISGELERSDFGILCVTPTNLQAPWLLFEAGALSKSVSDARVVPLLWRLSTSDVTSPLSQFQMKTTDETGIRDLVTAINGLADRPRSDAALASAFTGLWPQLQERLSQVRVPVEAQVPQRPDREILEEILELVRATGHEVTQSRFRSGIPVPPASPLTKSDLTAIRTSLRNHGFEHRIERTGPNQIAIFVEDEASHDRLDKELQSGAISNLPGALQSLTIAIDSEPVGAAEPSAAERGFHTKSYRLP